MKGGLKIVGTRAWFFSSSKILMRNYYIQLYHGMLGIEASAKGKNVTGVSQKHY